MPVAVRMLGVEMLTVVAVRSGVRVLVHLVAVAMPLAL